MEMLEEIKDFVRESNKIEGILREPTFDELCAYDTFMDLEHIPQIDDLIRFVSVYQPDAKLRLNGEMVYVGKHVPPAGGIHIKTMLMDILFDVQTCTPYEIHQRYEKLHPFTDCNGRSGRMLWRWMMGKERDLQISFLHHWYYQSLANQQPEGS